jgi:hypothetical protein
MSHFAKLDKNNIVIFVTVGRQEDDGKEAELCERTGDVYKQTSYNTIGGVYYDPTTREPGDQSKAFRKNYAGLGYYYDSDLDAFIPPKPFDSWILDEDTCQWEAPLPYPTDGLTYFWNEAIENWELRDFSEVAE